MFWFYKRKYIMGCCDIYCSGFNSETTQWIALGWAVLVSTTRMHNTLIWDRLFLNFNNEITQWIALGWTVLVSTTRIHNTLIWDRLF